MGEASGPSKPNNSQNTTLNGGMTVEQCQKRIQKSLRRKECPARKAFFKAVDCRHRKVSGSYTPGMGIIVCSNHMNLQDEINQVIIHELIHAYDDCRAANMNWSNCAHHACSEIRAGHLSGDCHFKRELLRGYMKLRGHEQDCVKRRVVMSMASNPFCKKAAAKDAIEAVWDTCYNDTKPFDSAP